MKKLLLVDGSNLLFQMFFGMPARIVNRSGRAIHGTVGFVGALLKIIRMTHPTHVAVLFDGEHENARSALNAEYKANRIDYGEVPEAENPFSQLPDIYAALDFLGVKHAETVDCETDDWIASYARSFGGETEIVISSFDSDYFQLLSESVSLLRYRGERTVVCTPAYLREKFGITPAQYADFKSLVGDASDNLRGAEKVGPKTAALLLGRFATLEGVLQNAEKIERISVRAAILRDAERLRTNYELIKLKGENEVPFSLGELLFGGNLPTVSETLKGIGLLP